MTDQYQYQQQANMILPQIANFSDKTRTGDLLFGFTYNIQFSSWKQSMHADNIILNDLYYDPENLLSYKFHWSRTLCQHWFEVIIFIA